MSNVLNAIHHQHKVRQQRIKNAAFKRQPTPRELDIPDREPQGSFEIVLFEVCKYYHVRPQDILSPRRLNNIALPRHIMVYLLCRMTRYTTHKLAPKMERDPSSVYYAFKSIEAQRERYREALEALEAKLEKLLPKREILT